MLIKVRHRLAFIGGRFEIEFTLRMFLHFTTFGHIDAEFLREKFADFWNRGQKFSVIELGTTKSRRDYKPFDIFFTACFFSSRSLPTPNSRMYLWLVSCCETESSWHSGKCFAYKKCREIGGSDDICVAL